MQELDQQLNEARRTSFIGGLFGDIKKGLASYSTDIMNSFASNLELKLSNIHIKIMLQELKDSEDQDLTTLHVTIDTAMLSKSDDS